MNDDAQLLRCYAEEASESAFSELVSRHIDLVYSAALRQVGGDAHLAQDVAQTVFADLARKARIVSRHGVLTGWLYQATRHAASKVVRTERRRATREKEALAMQELSSEANWDDAIRCRSLKAGADTSLPVRANAAGVSPSVTHRA